MEAPAGALSAWIAEPCDRNTRKKDEPPLVAVHGISRDAREQAALFGDRAALAGRTVIAPSFDKASWPAYQRLVEGGRADIALLDLVRRLNEAGVVNCDVDADGAFDLFGFSGGAQFAHRFALAQPGVVRALTVAAAGWYTFPDDIPYPLGFMKPTNDQGDWEARMRAGLDDFLRLPITVAVGARDSLIDKNTRKGPEIDRQQGRTRLGRARNWEKALRAAAATRGLDPSIRFELLLGCGHSFRECVVTGGLDRLVLPDPASDTMTDTTADADELARAAS